MRYSAATSKHNQQLQPFFSRLAAIVVVAFTPSALAETSAGTPLELEEVIVTAQKREQHLIDVPMSVSVVSRQGPIHLTDRSIDLANPFGESDTLGILYANLGLQLGRTIIELFGRNLLDENGISNPYESFASGTQPRPRESGIRLAWSFH